MKLPFFLPSYVGGLCASRLARFVFGMDCSRGTLPEIFHLSLLSVRVKILIQIYLFFVSSYFGGPFNYGVASTKA